MREEYDEDIYNTYDKEELFEHMQKKLYEGFLSGEIDREEYEGRMSQITKEDEPAADVEGAKAKKYDELQQMFISGEMTEQELEEEMDKLFKSGDDFLEYEESDEPIIDTSAVSFRVREVVQIVLAFTVIGVGVYVIAMTKGLTFPLIAPIILAYVLYKL